MALAGEAGREPGDVAKIGIGSALIGVSALFMVAGSLSAGPDGRAAVYWPLACFAGMGIAFLYYWPVLLALVSQAAPAKVNATLMGGAFLALVRRQRDDGLGRQLSMPK